MRKLLAMVLCLAMCLGVLAMTASAASDYYVAGTAGLCGVEWDAGAAANKMTDNGDGTYTKVYKNVPAGDHEFKVTIGNWNESWGSNENPSWNYYFKLDAESDVTITFNAETHYITVVADALGEATVPEIKVMCLKGEGLDGLDWTIENESIAMTKVSEGVYEYTFKNLSNVSFKFKFAANGNWSDYNFGGAFSNSGEETEAVWNAGDISMGVTETADVTIKLDLTGFDYATKTGATFTVTVTPVGGSDDNKEDNKTEDDKTEGDKTEDDKTEEVEMITVYAKVPADWTSVSAYIWDGNGTDNTWPGAVMTKNDNGWWTVQVPAWAKNIIINNGGNGAQTQDIAIDSGKDVCVVVEAVEGGFHGELTYGAPKTGDTEIVALTAAMILAAAGCAVVAINKNKIA